MNKWQNKVNNAYIKDATSRVYWNDMLCRAPNHRQLERQMISKNNQNAFYQQVKSIRFCLIVCGLESTIDRVQEE